MSWDIRQADCVEAMATMPEASVDAIVCDPPYGLEFMGKEWDRLDRPSDSDGFRRAQNAADVGREGIHGRLSRVAPEYKTGTPTARWGAGYRATGAVPQSGRRPVSDQPGAHDEGYRNMRGHERAMQEWHYRWAREALRVLKPGGHLLAFGGTRTYHRLACAVEDAGFEIRDSILYGGGGAAESSFVAWMYGSG